MLTVCWMQSGVDADLLRGCSPRNVAVQHLPRNISVRLPPRPSLTLTAYLPHCSLILPLRYSGGFVWCDGLDMRPRKIFIQLPGGKPSSRCACMEGMGWTDVRQVGSSSSCRCAPTARIGSLLNPRPHTHAGRCTPTA